MSRWAYCAGILVAGMVGFAGIAASSSDHPQVAKGASLYKEFCQKCHGADGQKGEGAKVPIWGPGAEYGKFETVLGLFEYMQMVMPFDDPGKVTDEQRWDIIAYLLKQHGTLKPGEALDIASAGKQPIK